LWPTDCYAEADQGSVKTAILLIDCELAFVFWLGRALDKAGYEAFPARSIPDAVKLMAELHLSVGLVILNCSLPGAADFIAELRGTQKFVKIIALVEDANLCFMQPGIDCQVCRPKGNDEASKIELCRQIRQVLGSPALSSMTG